MSTVESHDGLAEAQELFAACHMICAKRSKLGIFLRELGSGSRREALSLQKIISTVEELVLPPLKDSVEFSDSTEELCALISSVKRIQSSKGERITPASGTSSTTATLDKVQLGDLADTSLVSSLVSSLFVCARDADRQLSLKCVRLNQELASLLQDGLAMKQTTVTVVSQELSHLSRLHYLQDINLSKQVMTEGQVNLLVNLISTRPTIRSIDLSSCLLHDIFLKKAFPGLSKQANLVSLLLDGNGFTDAVMRPLLQLAIGSMDISSSVVVASRTATESSNQITDEKAFQTKDGDANDEDTPPSPVNSAIICPRLQVLECRHGNELSDLAITMIEEGIINRFNLFAPVIPHDHLPPLHVGLNPSQEECGAVTPHRVLSFDGGVMNSLAQLYWEQQVLEANTILTAMKRGGNIGVSAQATPHLSAAKKELLDRIKDLPELSEVHTVVGSGFGAIAAAAFALGIPTEDVQTFFSTLAEQVFYQGYYSYYALAAGRMIRDWWTGGSYYSAGTLKQELEKLFGARTTMESRHPEGRGGGETRGGVTTMSSGSSQSARNINLMLVASTVGSGGSANPSEIAVFTSYQHPHLKLVDVLMACCSFEGFFAPYPISDSAGLLPPVGTAANNRGRSCPSCTFKDGETECPNPALTAIMELSAYVPLGRMHLTSVSTSIEQGHPAGFSACRPSFSHGTSGVHAPPSATGAVTTGFNPLLIKAITTRALQMSPEERQKHANPSSSTGGGSGGGGQKSQLPSDVSVLRERRLDALADSTHTTVHRNFQFLVDVLFGNSSSSSSRSNDNPPQKTEQQQQQVDVSTGSTELYQRWFLNTQDHRSAKASTVTATHASHHHEAFRIGLEEDDTFLLGEVLWTFIHNLTRGGGGQRETQ